MQDSAKDIAEILKVLGNENRLLILCALIDSPCSVNKLLEFTPNISQSAMSQHLALMKAHRILDCTKSGQTITYFIADERVTEIIGVLKKYYCGCNQ